MRPLCRQFQLTAGTTHLVGAKSVGEASETVSSQGCDFPRRGGDKPRSPALQELLKKAWSLTMLLLSKIFVPINKRNATSFFNISAIKMTELSLKRYHGQGGLIQA